MKRSMPFTLDSLIQLFTAAIDWIVAIILSFPYSTTTTVLMIRILESLFCKLTTFPSPLPIKTRKNSV